eukprot:TRINITY_DN22228_c1_g1_i3.p1 TRINITY_DN22228_c1_g1~~TRINITY_DN22228_c1_g1_i3.p1  ORF type:complete len:439 (+),score=59.90 TRINITY_DN22228_c1_g1_i3:107-1423(+)
MNGNQQLMNTPLGVAKSGSSVMEPNVVLRDEAGQSLSTDKDFLPKVDDSSRASSQNVLPKIALPNSDGAAGESKAELYVKRKPSRLLTRRKTAPSGISIALDAEETQHKKATQDGRAAWPGYEVLDILGQGSSGRVMRGKRQSDNQVVAMKVLYIREEEERLADARREYDIMQACAHPNIVKALDFLVAPLCVCIVMEHFPGPTLAQAVQDNPFSESAARPLFRMLVQAIAFLHGKRIIHRDIKPDNIKVASDASKLCLLDFGTAKLLQKDGGSFTPTGTSSYMPPEVLDGSERMSDLADVWAAGLCLHFMLTGCLPWALSKCTSIAEYSRMVAIKPLELDWGPWRQISSDCKVILWKCLAVCKSSRTMIPQLLLEEWLLPPSEYGRQVSVESDVALLKSPPSPCKVAPLSPLSVMKPRRRVRKRPCMHVPEFPSSGH